MRLQSGTNSNNGEDDDLTNLPPPPNDDEQQPKLGIDIGKMLDPLSEQEAAELKAAAQEIINDAVAAGLDDIDALRTQMEKEITKKRAEMTLRSELTAQRESAKLLSRIDQLTDNFLKSTASTRAGTKLAAAADQAAAGRGLEVGVWGTVGGAAVTTTTDAALLGSVASSSTTTTTAATGKVANTGTTATQSRENRIVVLADTKADPYAKQLVPALEAAWKTLLSSSSPLEVTVYPPTATVPLGGDNAAAVVLFCTSYTDASSVKAALERVLRRTISEGAMGTPPTQIVAVSTVGTERTNKMPYSMQNMLAGGQLDKRRQMEEAVLRTVQQHGGTPPLDYTICKLGELKENDGPFQLLPGDAVDGTLAPATAVTVLTQALALQPAARNATLSCVGHLPLTENNEAEQQKVLDDAFLRLDGPELLRLEHLLEKSGGDSEKYFGQLVEYLSEWAEVLAETGKGLTTPIRADIVPTSSMSSTLSPTIQRQASVRLLFLPTATGKNYVSREEERERESERKQYAAPSSSPSRYSSQMMAKKEGGIEFSVEITVDDQLRVRAKRCNYGDDVVVKELSEETILSRFRKCMEVWKKDHSN